MDREKKQVPEDEKRKSREELADKVLEIFSESPEEMASLIELLKKMEENPALHPETPESGPDGRKGRDQGSGSDKDEETDREDRS
jgi:hypothetical protein